MPYCYISHALPQDGVEMRFLIHKIRVFINLSDLFAMFRKFDPTGSGSITAAQCRQAFLDLCLPVPSSLSSSEAGSVSLTDVAAMVHAARTV